MTDINKDTIETLLEEKLTDLSDFKKQDQKAKPSEKSRNRYTLKSFKSKFGKIDLDVPRYRRSEFESQAVKKVETKKANSYIPTLSQSNYF